MDAHIIERIRERAYLIWRGSGCPEGQADQHWLAAEREILQSAKTTAPAIRPAAKKPNRFMRRAAAKSAAAVLN